MKSGQTSRNLSVLTRELVSAHLPICNSSSLTLESASATCSTFSSIAVSRLVSWRPARPTVFPLRARCAGFLGDFLEQAEETLGEPLFGTSNGPAGTLLPSHSCQTRIRWPH
jgi:hypothetical protein